MDVEKALRAFEDERQNLIQDIRAIEQLIESRKKHGSLPAAEAPKMLGQTPPD